MHLEQVRASQLEAIWPHIEPTLSEVCERHPDFHSLDAFWSRFNSNAYQLWLVVDTSEDNPIRAVFCTEIYRTDVGAKICGIAVCAAANGSDAKDWVHLIPQVEGWAAAQGCKRMKPEARRGWTKMLRAMGYHPGHVILEKEL